MRLFAAWVFLGLALGTFALILDELVRRHRDRKDPDP